MGMVINFPASERQSMRMDSTRARVPGQVIILPVIRVERLDDRPVVTDTTTPRAHGRKRRRRVRS